MFVHGNGGGGGGGAGTPCNDVPWMNRVGCGEHIPNAMNPHIHVPSGKKGPGTRGSSRWWWCTMCFHFISWTFLFSSSARVIWVQSTRYKKKDTTDVCFTHVRPPGKSIHIIIEIRTWTCWHAQHRQSPSRLCRRGPTPHWFFYTNSRCATSTEYCLKKDGGNPLSLSALMVQLAIATYNYIYI